MIGRCGTGEERNGPLVGRGGRRLEGRSSGERRQVAGRGASRGRVVRGDSSSVASEGDLGRGGAAAGDGVPS